ncbi:Membrane protein involved in colicin uptake [Chitinispirillum alkaliphilum]|nr:Membrane protein involved in colicin uptake [Chitinispirillum alkaliphilum]
MQVKKNIWEIGEQYFCPVVGFCLSVEEQKKVYAKCTKGRSVKLNGIDLHEFLVIGISKDSQIARRVERTLNLKYAKSIEKYKGISFREWLKEIDSLLNPDDYGACIWISAAHTNWKKELNAQIYGKIHMYSHKMPSELKEKNRLANELQSDYETLSENYNELRSRFKWAQNEVIRLNDECNKLDKANVELTAKLRSVIEEKSEIFDLKDRVEFLQEQLKKQKNLTIDLQHENDTLRKNNAETKNNVESLKDDFSAVLKSVTIQQQSCCEECEKVDLCQKRVLIVGGLSKMLSYYRDLVHQLGGKFDYHDGRCHSGTDILNGQIKQSDVVICPVDINSHAACLQVKKSCKRARKHFYMLRKSSISSLYTTLITVANTN